ncbi:Endo/exonuclease/phosphatase domain-containing protein [Forsythia ovata]|uniref:Endo/exonuclease/phosphatase domain-containing protein n=1 Tax=Forsythia ovata TaxID=205694 RepID=A0ABD1TAD1_9LAMI
MEMEKRKRRDDGDADGKKYKSREDDGCIKQLPEDDEVDEFFAILRRIHVAVKYFEKRNRNGNRELTTPTWSPSFEREDFEEDSLDEIDYSQEGWTDIVNYCEETGKPTPKVEVMKYLKSEQYTDAKDFAGECESVVMIAKGHNLTLS